MKMMKHNNRNTNNDIYIQQYQQQQIVIIKTSIENYNGIDDNDNSKKPDNNWY